MFICNQEAHIKSKNIAEKIDFESELYYQVNTSIIKPSLVMTSVQTTARSC